MNKSGLLILILFLLIQHLAYPGEGYKIKISIEGKNDTILYLATYYGDKITVADSASKSSGRYYVFNGNSGLPPGLYMLIDQDKKKLFDLVIDKDQKFSIKTDTTDLIEKSKIKGSGENDLFFEYVQLTKASHNKIRELNKKINKHSKQHDQKLRDSISQLKTALDNYKSDFIEKHPDHILTLILNAVREPQIPEEYLTNDTLKFRYYKKNYWNNVTLPDERIIRTPVFGNKLKKYINNLTPKHPDSVIKEIDLLMSLSEDNKELMKYLTWYFIEKYDNPKLMGFDKVFVHVADQYFTNDYIYEHSASVKEAIKQRADKIRPLLLGKKAPDLILIDTNKRFISMHKTESEFTLLFFWDIDCGICKKEIARIKELLNQTRHDIEVFAVCTDTNLNQWKEEIRKRDLNWINANGTRSVTQDFHDLYDIYSTPVIYLLNRKKEIIAKRISADKIEEFLDYYNK